jgi:hypothetical protein
MHTITDLRKTLGLSTTNQVRNRIDAIKDLLTDYLRRGPNNQILLSDGGVALLRWLQDLYDSGLTITEASEVLRTSSFSNDHTEHEASPGFVSNEAKETADHATIARLEREIATLKARLAALEARVAAPRPSAAPWWEGLREEVE